VSVLQGHVLTSLSALDRKMIEAIPEGGNWMDIPEGLSARVDQIRERSRTRGLIHTTYYGRLRWDAPAYTISTFFTRSGNGCFIHPSEDRLITAREAARLQSFPDGFHFAGPSRAIATQIGNAVPPLLAFHVAGAVPGTRVVDLFAGAGGFSLGAAWAGKHTVLAVESDVRAVETYRNNHQGVDVWQTKLGPQESLDELESRVDAAGGLDILAGGPPCQSFSTAGHRASDERSTLVNTFVEAARRLRPAQVIMENVHGLRSYKQGRVLAAAMGDLREMGYDVDLWDLHAETYGVPQRRRRLFITASLGSAAPEIPPTLFPRFRQGRIRGVPTSAVTTRDAIGDLPTPTQSPALTQHLADAAGAYQLLMRGLTSTADALRELPLAPQRPAAQLRFAI
jgi:DNA (cytosine-5)-methyltransferase 1